MDFTCTYCHNLKIKCLVRLCFISDKPGISVICKVECECVKNLLIYVHNVEPNCINFFQILNYMICDARKSVCLCI